MRVTSSQREGRPESEEKRGNKGLGKGVPIYKGKLGLFAYLVYPQWVSGSDGVAMFPRVKEW